MGPKFIGKQIEKLGIALMILGAASIAGVFLVVLINGTWPDFLSPIQDRARIISDVVGDAVWLAWIAAFIGPGFLVQLLGQWLQSD